MRNWFPNVQHCGIGCILENQGIQKRKTKFWIKEATYDIPGEAEESIENDWSIHYTSFIDATIQLLFS